MRFILTIRCNKLYFGKYYARKIGTILKIFMWLAVNWLGLEMFFFHKALVSYNKLPVDLKKFIYIIIIILVAKNLKTLNLLAVQRILE